MAPKIPIDINVYVRRQQVRLLFEHLIKKSVYPLIQLAVVAFQLLVPPCSRRICYMSQPDFSDSAYAMFRYLMLNQTGLEHIWVVRERGLEKRIQSEFECLQRQGGGNGHRLVILRRRDFFSVWRVLRAKVLFHTHGTYGFHRFSWRRKVVNVWHGMPIKCIGRLNTVTPNPFPTFGTHHIASSAFFQYVIAQAFSVRVEKVVLSGLPRCDVLKGFLRPRCSRVEICRLLSLDAHKKIVLWMPTYRTEVRAARGVPSSFLDDMPEGFFDEIQRLFEKKGLQLLIKLHPFDLLNYSGVECAYDAITVMTAQDFQVADIPLYDLVAASDGLMTDVSSVMIDYLLTGRPIGLIGFVPGNYIRDLVFPPERLLLCHQVHNMAEKPNLDRFMQAIESGEQVGNIDNPAAIFNEDAHIYSCQVLAENCGLS